MKKIISIFIIITIISLFPISVSAHSNDLDILYDDCIPSQYIDEINIGDGYNEKWYSLSKNNEMKHIANSQYTVTTIRYYFYNTSTYGDIEWSQYLEQEQINEFKLNFINSMKKWNNVYFYINNGDYYTKRKIVNIIEGTEENHNVSIRPIKTGDIAQTKQDPFYMEQNETLDDENVNHIHCPRWIINVNVNLVAEYFNNELLKPVVLNRTGAHEVGHILGLYDIDLIENSDSNLYHHEEILMGYSSFDDYQNVTFQNRQTEITYRDIAGVAITRGYHSDNNHKWLCDETMVDEQYKLICSICNGVKYVESLENYSYNVYNSCNGRHNLVDGNMMPVASYNNKDYYKCSYCRYVAPFSSIVSQNYIPDNSYNASYHYIVNNIEGFEYRMLEEHEYGYNVDVAYCTHCNYSISMDNIIVTDPDYYTNCGSQINVYENDIPANERSYRENTIVQGFTRLLYFATSIAPSLSRLDYIWTSSDNSIATVSIYGTVTALEVSEPTSVIISAKHKTSDVILYKKLWIVPDSNEELMIINYDIQMNSDEAFIFVLDEKAPTQSIQNYNWRIPCQEDESAGVTISQWGTITAIAPGIMYIEGIYKLNSNIIISIKVTVS